MQIMYGTADHHAEDTVIHHHAVGDLGVILSGQIQQSKNHVKL